MQRTPIQAAIHLLFAGSSLSVEQADGVMTQIMQGEATPAQIGAFLAALRMKGETVDEITGCAQAMQRSALPLRARIGSAPLIDTCGTGGDASGTFNISTTAAFVVAGSGQKVAKHGNRSVSSQCGSADVLLALGANINLTPEQAASSLEEVGFAFLFAPVYHPAMRHAIGPRRELAARTVFNLLGPLTNPANATHQLIGVYDPQLTEPLAHVLRKLGSRAAYVVHGSTETGAGLDELSVCGLNRISHLRDGRVTTAELDPATLGIPRARLADLQGGDAQTNAALTRQILDGSLEGARRNAVLLNAAAALSSESGDWAAGLAAARQSLESGAALRTLEAFVAKSQSFA